MVYTLSYQMYKCEAGLSAAEQRAADIRAGAGAAAVREVPVGLGRVRRLRSRARAGGGAAGTMTRSGAAPMRLMSSGR